MKRPIQKDLLSSINKKWEGFPRKTQDITRIVFHGTGGGGTLRFMKGGGQGRQDEKIGLFHYLIEKDGQIIQLMEDTKWGYHSSSGKNDRNSIGIEFLKTHAKNQTSITLKQFEASMELLRELCLRYPNIRIVQSHDYARKRYSNLGQKPCPGTFPWKEIMAHFPELRLEILDCEKKIAQTLR